MKSLWLEGGNFDISPNRVLFNQVLKCCHWFLPQLWSAQTGQCMQQLEPVAEAEVTGVVPLTDCPALLSVGWSRQITTYDDSNPEVKRLTSLVYTQIALYSGPPLLRPPLGNDNCGCIRGMAAGEGYIRYVYKGYVLKNCGRIRGVATGEGGRI